MYYPDNTHFKRFAGNTEDFYLDFSGNLCYNDKKISHKVYLENVTKVISTDHPYSRGIFFITNDGKLYAANKGSLGDGYGEYGYYSEPFLTVFSEKTTNIYMNAKEVKLTAKLQSRSNRTMYPFRECLEQLGATVLWDAVNKIAIGEYNGITIEFPIGKHEYWINGVKHEMDVASYIDESIGRTYIPIRYAAEGLGFTVDWEEGILENTISIYR